jgi:hypothetical protein
MMKKLISDHEVHLESGAPPQQSHKQVFGVARSTSRGDVTLPLVLGILAVAFGLAGWSAALFDNTFKSVSEIIVRVIASFIPSANNVIQGNWASRLGAVFAALTTVTGAVMVGLATLGEHFTRTAVRRLWSDHTILIGDTPLIRRLADGLRSAGQRVLHVVPADTPKAFGTDRVRLDTNAPTILAATALHRAQHVVVDLGSDATTLSLGKSLLTACDTNPRPPSIMLGWPQRSPKRQPASLALRVADSVLAEQFSEIIDEERARDEFETEAPLRPTIFDENGVLARYTLARDPLFIIADTKRQAQVHAVVLGFGDLGEKLLDQVMLTSVAGSLGLPRVTVLDRHAGRRAREFRARRPRVLESLDIMFLDFDIGLDPFQGVAPPSQFGKLVELEKSIGITAIFLALPSDSENLRAAMLLRSCRKRTGMMNAPSFYRSLLSAGESDVLGAVSNRDESDRFIPMRVNLDALVREVADLGGRDALARALHENYLKENGKSEPAVAAWDHLNEPLRRANIRAADHLPAKLWSLGFNISGLLPGTIPAFDNAAKEWLFGKPGALLAPEAATRIASLTKLEHDRWSIERKLDGWTYAMVRNEARREHPLLVPWEELKKSPDEVAKDAAQIMAALRFVSERGKQPLISLR